MLASPSERGLRSDLVRYSHLIYQKGWVANHDGNLTARARAGRIVATPTSVSKGDVDDEGLLVVDERGERVAGRTQPFSELVLHLAIYAARSDVQAVVHAHPPYATAMACAGVGLETPFMPEAVVSLGERIPLVRFAAPRTPEYTASLAPYLPLYDAVLLENHGVLAWGSTLKQAFLRLELVEHLARIATLAQPWGGVQPLSQDVVATLLQARRRAGLGPEARGVDAPRPTPALPRSAPPAAPFIAASARSSDAVPRDELVQVIAEELGAVLREQS